MSQPLESNAVVIEALDLDGLQRLANWLLEHVPAGTTFGLVGTLGAGKTTLVQAIARAAGIDVSDVTSPTFTLLQTHQGTITIHHLDAYRLADEDEFIELGIDELFADPAAWTLVEWADRVRRCLPPEALWIDIEIQGDTNHRQLRLHSADQKWIDTFAKLAPQL